jgi:hypothetical protein
LVVAGTATPTLPAAAPPGPGRTYRYHHHLDADLAVEFDRLDHGVLDTDDPFPYSVLRHPAWPPSSWTVEKPRNLGTMRGVTADTPSNPPTKMSVDP